MSVKETYETFSSYYNAGTKQFQRSYNAVRDSCV